MTKSNKVLEALERVRDRIDTEVMHLKRIDDEHEDGAYAIGVNKVLREEIDKAVRAE